MLSLENTPSTSPDHINAVFGVVSAMTEATGRVGMCLDSGHANLHAGTRNDYVRFVDLLGAHVPIIHWHAHENWGDRDSHLTLFTGPSARDDRGLRALASRLLRRGFSGSVVLEQWPQPPELLLQARDRLRLLLETISEAAAGLQRELAISPTDARPADTVEAVRADVMGAHDVAGQARAVDDPAILDALLALPRAA